MPKGHRKNFLPVVYYAGHHMQDPFDCSKKDFYNFSKLLEKFNGVILKTTFYEGRFIVLFHVKSIHLQKLEKLFNRGPFLSINRYGKSVEKYGKADRQDFYRVGLLKKPKFRMGPKKKPI